MSAVFRSMFTRRWILTTLLAVAACAVMARLGIWQLDRLEQRRAFNARVLEQQAAPELALDATTLELDLPAMEYRQVSVAGQYDPSGEVALRNQAHEGVLGYRLLTPLIIEGTGTAVLVNRGFVAAAGYTPGDGQTYAVRGRVEVLGVIRRSQDEADFGSRTDPTPLPGEKLLVWNLVNVSAIAAQIDAPLLGVYIQEIPSGVVQGYPLPEAPDLELTEGPHLGYAIQWFLFAAVLALGYPFFVRREMQSDKNEPSNGTTPDR